MRNLKACGNHGKLQLESNSNPLLDRQSSGYLSHHIIDNITDYYSPLINRHVQYSAKASEDRHVPARFLIRGPQRAGTVTIRVPKRKRCGDVKGIIKDDARAVISSILNYSGDFEIDLLTKDNKVANENDSTDVISSIGMIILESNSPFIEPIISRITFLESDNISLKADSISLKADNISLKADMAFIKLRALIEQERDKYWETRSLDNPAGLF